MQTTLTKTGIWEQLPRRRRNKAFWGVLVAVLGLGLVGGTAALIQHSHGNHDSETGPGPSAADAADYEDAITVKVIRPKSTPLFVRSIKEPAHVEGFYRADLFAQVPGTVKYIQKDIGSPVTEREVLVELDVPDLVKDVAEKASLVKQAEAAVKEAEVALHVYEAEEKAARTKIAAKEAERDYRAADLKRYKKLFDRGTLLGEDLDVAELNWKSASVAVEAAKSDLAVVQAKSAAASVDIEVKRARVAVARDDLARAEAQADFAKIRAPFDGVIVQRNVDPGSFVQNASTARTKPMLSMVSLNKVTVYAMVADKDASYVSSNTEAIFELNAAFGQKARPLRGKVARSAPFMEPETGMRMRVEVDLFNPPGPSYKRSVVRGVGAFLAPLASACPAEATSLAIAGKTVWARPGRLMHGDYGSLKLVLQKFENVYLIPSSAVFVRDGRTCLLEVVDGTAKLLPARVQLDDGVQAKIQILTREADPASADEDVVRELTGNEEIILSGQGEIADGEAVRPTETTW